jgi:hypothetical protein
MITLYKKPNWLKYYVIINKHLYIYFELITESVLLFSILYYVTILHVHECNEISISSLSDIHINENIIVDGCSSLCYCKLQQ